MKPIRRAARSMLSLTFIAGGVKSLMDPEQFVADAKPVTDRVAPFMDKASALLPETLSSRGIGFPTETRGLIRLNGAVQLLAGLLMLTRLHRPAAAVLAGSLVPSTLAAHPFWQYANPVQQRIERANFAKNLGLLGGLLLAAADTQGKPGLRWRTGRLIHDAADSAGRTARTAKREARIAVRAAQAGRRLGHRVPG